MAKVVDPGREAAQANAAAPTIEMRGGLLDWGWGGSGLGGLDDWVNWDWTGSGLGGLGDWTGRDWLDLGLGDSGNWVGWCWVDSDSWD